MYIDYRSLNAVYASEEAKEALRQERSALFVLAHEFSTKSLLEGDDSLRPALLTQEERVKAARERVYREGGEAAPQLPQFLMRQHW